MVFKRISLILLLALSALAPMGVVHATPHAVTTAADKKDCTVYITRTGARYHKASCSSLRRSKMAMSRSEAISGGYTPCRRCGGSDCEE